MGQKMAEEYAHEAEEEKAQQNADAAMARSMSNKEVNDERQGRRGTGRKYPLEELRLDLREHVETDSDMKLRCEA